MFAVKTGTLSVVPSMGNGEIMDPNERLKKVLAEAKALDTARQAEINAVRQSEIYHRGMHSEIDQILRETTKTHNEHSIMSARIKLGMVENDAKLIARLEFNDMKIAELENQKAELQAQRDHAISQHAVTKDQLDQISYSKLPVATRLKLAVFGKRN